MLLYGEQYISAAAPPCQPGDWELCYETKGFSPKCSHKLLTRVVSSHPILFIKRLNIHSWGDLTSCYNSPGVMISPRLPSAPVRSNLSPLQEAIIRRGKSYVSLTMLHFHHNGSRSLSANSYQLQTIRVYCGFATCTQHCDFQTHAPTKLLTHKHTNWHFCSPINTHCPVMVTDISYSTNMCSSRKTKSSISCESQ